MERTHGLWAVLGAPQIYAGFQNALGAEKAWRALITAYVRPFAGMTMLDLGCGPCDVLALLPGVTYVGIDRSQPYIERARARFGARGAFLCGDVSSLASMADRTFDIVTAFGLLHHLDDRQAGDLVRDAANLVAPGGRFVSVDPVIVAGQNRIARLAIDLDRGGHVREAPQYAALVGGHFAQVHSDVRHDLLRIPYSHLIMEARR